MMYMPNNSKKGSLTVEASIAFPIFLCFFLLLVFFVKVACVNIELDHAVNETAKQLAASCYPITFLNDIEDELLQEGVSYNIPTYEEEIRKIGDYVRNSINTQDIFTRLISGQLNADDIKEIINGIVDSIKGDFTSGIKGYLTSRYAKNYFDIKAKAKYAATAHLMQKFLQGSIVDPENIKIIMVEFPQGIAEFEIKSKIDGNKSVYEELNCSPDPDNVVIAVEYRIKVPIPFFSGRDIVTRHVAVERAWLHGSNGIYETEGSEEDDGNEDSDGGKAGNDNDNSRIVYVTNTGSKYHESWCEYLKKSRRPISIDYALEKGYAPCKVCVLKTSEYVWKKKH